MHDMMHTFGLVRRLAGTLAIGLSIALAAPARDVSAQQVSGGTLRVAVIADIANFDPHQFSFVNATLIKNLYDSLLEYTQDGKAIPSLAESWQIAPDSKSVTLSNVRCDGPVAATPDRATKGAHLRMLRSIRRIVIDDMLKLARRK